MKPDARLALTIAASFAALRCGPPTAPPPSDGGADSAPSCAFELSPPASLAVGQGVPLRVGITGAQARTSVTVSSTPEGAWGAASAPFDAVIVRAPYGASGAVTVRVEATCDNGATAQRELSLQVRALQWRALPTWTGGDNGPLGREYGSMWIDPSEPDRMLVYGGFVYVPQQFTPSFDWWEYSLTAQAWTRLAPMQTPPGLPGGRIALAAEPAQALFFGGITAQQATPQGTYRVHFGRDNPRWEPIDVMSSRRSGDYQPGLVWDAPRRRFVSFCGVNAMQGNHCNVWLFDPSTQRWTASNDETSESVPEGRAGFAYVHDVSENRVVMFSGDMGGSMFAEGTWQLDLAQTPPRWSSIATQGPACTPRRNGGFALDPDGHRMLLWGGTNDGRTSVAGLWMLSLDRGHERWSRVDPPPNGPRIRSSSMIVYDAARRRFVMGFGNGPQPFTDLWALEL
jgi:hypothetical protein